MSLSSNLCRFVLGVALALTLSPSLAGAQESSEDAAKRARSAKYRMLKRQAKPQKRKRSGQVEDWAPRESVVRSLDLHPRVVHAARELESKQIVGKDRPAVHSHDGNPLHTIATPPTPSSSSTGSVQ